MSGIDRRGVLLGAASAVAVLAIPAAALPVRLQPALFIFDGRLAAGRRASGACRAAGIAVLDRNLLDLGQAWRSRIPAIVRTGGGPIAGLTLWVDSYICETFGREHGLTMRRDPGVQGEGLHGWTLGVDDGLTRRGFAPRS